MCTRLTLSMPDPSTVVAALGLDPEEALLEPWTPRYNVAPTQLHPVVSAAAPRVFTRAAFGMGPQRQINARVETLAARGFNRVQRPCVVPADGFLEWEGPKNARQPVHFTAQDGAVLLMAGVTDGAGFAVLTTGPDALVRTVHDRMPVLLRQQDVKGWLTQEGKPHLEAAVIPLRARRVSRRINTSTVDDAACLADAEVEPAAKGVATQLKLFG